VQAVLSRYGIEPEVGRKLLWIAEQEIGVEGIDGKRETITASKVILCAGRTPANSLANELRGRGLVIQVIGDSRQPRSFGNAIHEAAYLSRTI
jgi:hypothetical protein